MSESPERGGQEVIGVARVEGPIVVVEKTGRVGYDDVAHHTGPETYDFCAPKGMGTAADARERDFTINALSLRIWPVEGEAAVPVIDPTGGLADLEAGIEVPAVILDAGFVIHAGNRAEVEDRMWGARVAKADGGA